MVRLVKYDDNSVNFPSVFLFFVAFFFSLIFFFDLYIELQICYDKDTRARARTFILL